MNLKLIDGKHLEGEELTQRLNSLYKDERFGKLVTAMQQNAEFDVKQMQVSKAYVFDAVFGEKDDFQLYNATIIHLVDTEKNISILYNELPKFENHYYGQALSERDSRNMLVYDFNDNGEIMIDQTEAKLDILSYQDEYDLPNNPNYKPLTDNEELINDKIEPTFWWLGDGCLPGGYQHCGGNCGYGLKHGGGTPINATDTCCVAHDRCWKVFGSKDACCDKHLVDCVKNHTTVAATGIRTYFGPNAKKCK